MPITFTRRGRYRLTRDGVEISRHNVELEAVERGFSDAETRGAGKYRIYPPDYVEFDVPVITILAGGRAGGVQAGGGGGGGGSYAATHYVAPFASVAGASNDYDDLGATSWTNAASSGTPTTLGTAMARAVAGNKIRIGTGVYVRAWVGAGVVGFEPANSGSFGNPIVFFAETPAATNLGTPAAFSEIRWSGQPAITSGGAAVLAAASVNYIVYDGLFLSRTYAPPYASRGAISISGTGNECRRIAYDYVSTTTADDNFAAFWVVGAINPKILDCYVENNFGSGGHNAACVSCYGAQGITVKNCTFDNVNNAIFLKSTTDNTSGTPGNYGEISYNKVNGGSFGFISIQHTEAGQTASVHHNLCIDSGGVDLDSSGHAGDRDFEIYSNTFVGGSSNNIVMLCDGLVGWTEDGRVYNNLFVDSGGTVTRMWYTDSASFAAAFSGFNTLDYNVYYDTGGASFFGGSAMNFTNYRSALSSLPANAREASSQEATVTLDGSYKLTENGQAALTASNVGGRVGCFVTNSEEIGIRANPTY